jgi:hypothetical protein
MMTMGNSEQSNHNLAVWGKALLRRHLIQASEQLELTPEAACD